MEIAVGDELEPFRRQAGFHAWNRFAAVNEEFVPIHMDDVAAAQTGLSGAIGMGNLQLAYLHAMLRHWLGETGLILRVSCRYRAPSRRSATTSARGRVTAVSDDGTLTVVELDVWTENDDGAVPARGTATVGLPR